MIQVFGTKKSPGTRAAERFFKERRVPFQLIDLAEKGLSRAEFDSVVAALSRTEGSREKAVEALADKGARDYASFAWLDDGEKEGKLFEDQRLLAQPVCRNGRELATVGVRPEVWKGWLP